MAKTYPYLKLCVESVRNLNYPKEDLDIILVCHKRDSEKYSKEFPEITVIAPGMDDFNNEVGLNIGAEHASPDSKYFFFLNDDVILSKHSLINLVQGVGDNKIIASPIAPCDQGRQFNLVFGVNHEGKFVPFQKPFYRLEEVEHLVKDIMDTGPIYPPGFIFTDFHCLFAGFMSRQVWEKVGKFDESYRKAGPSDLDYSLRAQQMGIRCAFVLDSFVFHFGGAGSESGLSPKDRAYNARAFNLKWGFHQPGISDSLIEQWEKESAI
jgi:GT2 family glycosyltransferase